MGFREDLLRRIEKKRAEINELEAQLSTSRTYLQALEDMQKMASKEPVASSNNAAASRRSTGRPSSDVLSFRAGSLTGSVYDALKKAGRPLHVNMLLEAVGREVTRAEKSAVSGTLAGYVKRGVAFTRPAPNTFGLLEFADVEAADPPAPPPGFGKL